MWTWIILRMEKSRIVPQLCWMIPKSWQLSYPSPCFYAVPADQDPGVHGLWPGDWVSTPEQAKWQGPAEWTREPGNIQGQKGDLSAGGCLASLLLGSQLIQSFRNHLNPTRYSIASRRQPSIEGTAQNFSSVSTHHWIQTFQFQEQVSWPAVTILYLGKWRQ